MLSSTRMDLQKARVLLVDDNAQSLELLTQVLLGFRVEKTSPCRTPAEARDLLATAIFDLIIIDGEMPGEDGISLTQYIRREPDLPNFTAPIILVSGHTPKDKVIRARDAGANIIVKKPIAPVVLLSRIEWLARSAREFVSTPTYCGPDRRYQHLPLPEGLDERRSDTIALTANLDRAMSQNEVDSLFG